MKKDLILRKRIDIEHEYRCSETITNIANKIKRNKSIIFRKIDCRQIEGRVLITLIELIKNIMKEENKKTNKRKLEKYENKELIMQKKN